MLLLLAISEIQARSVQECLLTIQGLSAAVRVRAFIQLSSLFVYLAPQIHGSIRAEAAVLKLQAAVSEQGRRLLENALQPTVLLGELSLPGEGKVVVNQVLLLVPLENVSLPL